MLLTTVTGILKPFAWILGIILNGIYWLISLIGINNIAVCIVFFTLAIRMIMLPLTIKQQKFTKLSSKMQPELQEIQEKYKGKKDQESQLKMQNETQEVYRKYGASPLGGCLPLLITLPILFALYRVIYKIPAYVSILNGYYTTVVDAFLQNGNLKDFDTSVIKAILGNFVNGFGSTNASSYISKITADNLVKTCIDVFSNINVNGWNALLNNKLIDSEAFNTLVSAAGQTNGTWTAYLTDTIGSDYMFQIYKKINDGASVADLCTLLGITDVPSSITDIKQLSDCIYWNTYACGSTIATNTSVIDAGNYILGANKFLFGLSVLDSSGWRFPGILIPIFAAGTQFIQTKLTTATTNTNSNKKQDESPMAQSMKSMTTIMPIISGVICITLPIGVGIYWIAGTVIQIFQQIFINIYLEKTSIDDIIEKSVAKNEKRLEKYGIKSAGTTNVSSIAKTATKSYNNNKSISDISKVKINKDDKESDNSSAANNAPNATEKTAETRSISDIANIMKNRNK